MFRRASRLYSGARTHPDTLWWQDALNGALLGDFAHRLGFWGAATQVLLSFMPVVGDVAAARDMAANWRQRDHIDVLLNLLVMVPFIGGFAKVAQVMVGTRRLGRRLHMLPRPGKRRKVREREQGAA